MITHLARAIAPIALDAIGMIVFAALIALDVGVVPAAIVSIVIAVALVAWELALGRSVPPLQWLSLVIVLISAGATLFTGDARFVMVKPTIIYLAIGSAMLQRGWMNRYVAPDDIDYVRDMMELFGFVWAGLMFVTAAANLVIALVFTSWWPLFVAVFPLGSKLALFAIQFGVTYTVGRARGKRHAEQAAKNTVAPA